MNRKERAAFFAGIAPGLSISHIALILGLSHSRASVEARAHGYRIAHTLGRNNRKLTDEEWLALDWSMTDRELEAWITDNLCDRGISHQCVNAKRKLLPKLRKRVNMMQKAKAK